MAKWGEGDPRWIVEERADATNVNNWHWWVSAGVLSTYTGVSLIHTHSSHLDANMLKHTRHRTGLSRVSRPHLKAHTGGTLRLMKQFDVKSVIVFLFNLKCCCLACELLASCQVDHAMLLLPAWFMKWLSSRPAPLSLYMVWSCLKCYNKLVFCCYKSCHVSGIFAKRYVFCVGN